MNRFEVAAGSILGADHLKLGRNNQDAWWVQRSDSALVAVVSDGCGSCPHSEVGSKLGSRLVATRIHDALGRPGFRLPPDREALQAILNVVLNQTVEDLRAFSATLGGTINQVLNDYFLFTVVGGFLTPETAGTFSLGDGLLAVNGQISRLGPFPGNKPPYLMYRGFSSGASGTSDPSTSFQIHHLLPVSELESMLIGTDGACDLMNSAEEALPGGKEPLGPLSQFWKNDFHFKNPDGIRRRLALANNPVSRPDWEHQRITRARALLRDDTTLIAIRQTAGRRGL